MFLGSECFSSQCVYLCSQFYRGNDFDCFYFMGDAFPPHPPSTQLRVFPTLQTHIKMFPGKINLTPAQHYDKSLKLKQIDNGIAKEL